VSQLFVDAVLPYGHQLRVLEGISRGFSAVKTEVHTASERCSRNALNMAGGAQAAK
jgi:hypothetical protein